MWGWGWGGGRGWRTAQRAGSRGLCPGEGEDEGVDRGNRGSKGGQWGCAGLGAGEKPESQKARTGAAVGGGAGVVGGEDPRVREHNTRQLMAALWVFCSHFKVGFAVDWFKKGI